MKFSRALLLTAALAACSTDQHATSRQFPLSPTDQAGTPSQGANAVEGQVYTMSNDPAGNEVLVFDRGHDGALTPAGSYATGSLGTGVSLGNQGGVTLDAAGRFLLVVNAGSNTVSSLRVNYDGSLTLADVQGSGGIHPISVTTSRGLVYVLNDGGAGNIAGLTISSQGTLAPIAGSSRPLSSATSGPAQISFDAVGHHLVVTEKATNLISSYTVDPHGMATGPVTTPSNGAVPFGFAFTNTNFLIVSEAAASAVSSYAADAGDGWSVVSPSVIDTQVAACWIAVTGNGRFAYTTNAGSGNISGYAIRNGSLTLLDANGVTGVIGAGSSPLDMAISRGDRFLYALAVGTSQIAGFAIGQDGSLTPVAGASGLPASADGLAAR